MPRDTLRMWFDSSHQPSVSDAPGPLFTRALVSMRLIWGTVYQFVKSQLWKLSELARAQITCRPEAIAEVSGEVQRHADPVGDGYVTQGLGVTRPTPISVLMDCDQLEASNYKPVTARSSSHLRYTCAESDRPTSFTVAEAVQARQRVLHWQRTAEGRGSQSCLEASSQAAGDGQSQRFEVRTCLPSQR